MREKKKLFLVNGTILTVTALLMNFATLVFNVYVSNKIGARAVGIFSLVMAVYYFFIIVSKSGLNVAVTVIVSEKFALNKNKQAIKAVRSCILFSLLLGLTAGFILIAFSNFITSICLHNAVSKKVLYLIALVLPFIAMSSCIISYFTTIRKAYKNAITQVFEFAIRMCVTIYLLRLNISKGVEEICISLILGDVIAEICSFTMIFILYIFDVKSRKLNNVHSFGQKINIIKTATPVAVTSYIRSLLSTLKQLIIPGRLEKSGISCDMALSQYGIINGMVMPVITFPTVFTDSYSSLLIPEISAYLAGKNYKSINFVSNKVIKITSAFAMCICSIIFIFSNEIGLTIYNNTETSIYFKIFSPLIFFMYLDHIFDCILKGLNKQFGVMCCNILDVALTICFIYFLLPKLGIKGYIISITFSELFNFAISLCLLIKHTKLKINFIDWILVPLICIIIALILIKLIGIQLQNLQVNAILNIVFYVFIYIILYIFVERNFFISKNL